MNIHSSTRHVLVTTALLAATVAPPFAASRALAAEAAADAPSTRALTDYRKRDRTFEARPGVTVRYVARHRRNMAAAPVPAAIILFAGGNGVAALDANGFPTNLVNNFLLRSWETFLRKGAAFVAVVDAPSDAPLPTGMTGTFRISADHATDIERIIRDIRRFTHLPVWLIGTSNGTLSVASVTSRLAIQGSINKPKGMVLTATRTHLLPPDVNLSVFNTNLAAIDVPSLIASHALDACPITKPEGAAQVRDALINAPIARAKLFTGGAPTGSDICGGRHYHGFDGIEPRVVKFIVDWIGARLP